MQHPMDHVELIQRTLGGDGRAFGELVDRYQHMVFTVCMRILRDRQDAEEAAQDTFVKAYRNLHAYGGHSKFSTWLYTIAYRSAITRGRRRQPSTGSLEDIPVHARPAAESTGAHHQEAMRHHLGRALARLAPEESAILGLFYLEELSIGEIATITGLGMSNVKVRLFRSRKRLEAALDKELNGEARKLLLNDA